MRKMKTKDKQKQTSRQIKEKTIKKMIDENLCFAPLHNVDYTITRSNHGV